ncbi:MAG: MFS transporter [Cellulomonadaceae bacterium]|jgi:NNP family nitrate/nitrite transporter-like MFS transporter|nr:MFS transporter [Cellulomonadaceae bacterium]
MMERKGSPGLQLAIATLGFLVNFWAWALLTPLGKAYFGKEYGLTAAQVSLLVAIPVVVGSLGRIPIGALADRFGARVMFPLVSLATIIPVLYIGLIAEPEIHSIVAVQIGGFFLGLAGTAFAIGIPHVSKWFSPEEKGKALGIFGIGMGGTAIAAFTTVPMFTNYSHRLPFIVVAIVLAAYAVLAFLTLRDPEDAPPPAAGSMWARTWNTMKMPVTQQLSWLYAIGFGGYVAFSVYLPTLLKTDPVYGLDGTVDTGLTDALVAHNNNIASLLLGVFVIIAVACRPLGGILSDMFGGVAISAICFSVLTAGAIALCFHPSLWVAFPIICIMGSSLGASSGATFALVGESAPPDKVGAVTGVVGAVGGLGGFVPPLVLGAIWDSQHSFRLGFILLAVVAAGTLAFTLGPVRKQAAKDHG